MLGDDLEGTLTAKVEDGEDGQETLGGEQEGYTKSEFGKAGIILLS